MNILVVHEVSYRRKIIYEIHEFPELLNLNGHQVTFLDFDEDATPETRSTERVTEISGRIHQDSQITLATPHSFGHSSIDRLWAVVSVVPLLFGLFRKNKFDVVLNYAVPTYGLQAALFARLFGVPIVHRALDVSSKIRESRWNPIISLWEKLVFLLANQISANNPAMELYVTGRLPKHHHDKVVVHYPPLDLGIFRRYPREDKLRTSLGILPSDKVLMYMGSFFYFSGLPDLIRGLEIELKSNPSLKLLLIGGGEQENELRRLTRQLGIRDQVIFTGFVAFRELPRYMTLGDVGLNPLQDSLVAAVAFPHKVLQYMGVGLPVVSTRLAGLHAAFGDNSGITWCLTTDEMVREALVFLELGSSELERLRDLQKNRLEELFSVESTVTNLEASLRSIAARRKIR